MTPWAVAPPRAAQWARRFMPRSQRRRRRLPVARVVAAAQAVVVVAAVAVAAHRVAVAVVRALVAQVVAAVPAPALALRTLPHKISPQRLSHRVLRQRPHSSRSRLPAHRLRKSKTTRLTASALPLPMAAA